MHLDYTFRAKGPEHNPKEPMMHKQLIRPDRLRRPPEQFSWIDHRLVRENRLRGCTSDAMALYLFLVTVADAEGLSYYGDESCARRLGLDPDRLLAARACLVRADLIAYKRPFYQVLNLDPAPAGPPAPPPSAHRGGRDARSFADILADMGGRS